MEEAELLNRAYSYAFYAAAAVVVALSTAFGSFPGLLASGILMLLSALYFKSGHIINSLLIKRSKVIALRNDYKLSSNLASLTRRHGAVYDSFSLAALRFDGPIDIPADSLRTLFEGIREPFEFSFSAMQADKKRLIDALDTRRRMKEISLSRLDSRKYDRSNQLKREIQLIESDIETISKGGSAFDTVVKLKAMSTADSEAEAARQSLRSLERICDSFLAATKLGYDIIKGEELLALAGASQ